MIAPGSSHETDYSKLFKLSVIASEDRSTTTGAYRRLSQPNTDSLGFSWQVSAHNQTNILISLDFDAPQFVSSSRDGFDRLAFSVTRPAVFKSALTFKQLEWPSETILYRDLPPMLANKD
jgi:hypothetical protein